VSRRFFTLLACAIALVACEHIADVDQYHVCSGAECDAGTDAHVVIDAGSDSAKTETCTGIDAGTAACGQCLEKSCATAAAACACDSVCVREIDCYIHSGKCSTCERTKTTTNAFLKCAADACPVACACR
jgi:hypothetical protein